MRWLTALCVTVLLAASPAWAATYHVDPTGNNTTGDGSESNPWATPQKCVEEMTAGDTCLVGDGEYTREGSNFYVVQIIATTAENGRSDAPITLKSRNPLGAAIVVPSGSNASTLRGIFLQRQWWVIEGFDFHDDGGTTLGSIGMGGIFISGSTGGNHVIKNNRFHDIGRGVCSSSSNAISGVFINGGSNILLENNRFSTIGRLRFGENGCASSPGGSGSLNHHDHAMYFQNSTGTTVRRNVCWDVNRGYCLHLFGGANSNFTFVNNTIAGKAPSWPQAPILLGMTLSTAVFKNNLFYDAHTSAFAISPSGGGFVPTSVTVSFNMQSKDDTSGDNMFTGSVPAGVTAEDNTDNTSLGFTDAGSNDFTLASGSAAINVGTPVSGVICNGVCDLGAFETIPTPTTALASGTTVDVTLPMDLNTPVLPASGLLGWVVKFNGTPRTTTANRHPTSDSIVRLTFDGAACTGASDNITVDHTVNNTTDSALVGGALNQKLFSFTGLAVDESGCGGGGGTPPSGPTVVYHFNDASLGVCCADASGNTNDGAVTGTPSLVTGFRDGALDFTDQAGQVVTAPYGSGVNPTLTSLTACALVAPDSTATRTLLGAPLGTNQRAYISIHNASWKIGVQGSNDGGAANPDFPVSAGTYAFPCIVFDKDAVGGPKATLWINAVKGTTENGAANASVKPYTSYSFAGNFTIGNGNGFNTNAAMGGVVDEVFIYPSALNQTEMTDLYQSLVNPSPPPPSSSREQKGHKFQRPFKKAGVAEDLRGVDEDGRVSRGGSVDVVIQLDCRGDDCPSFAPRIHRSIDGGATYAQINDVCGVICFRGTSTNTDLVSADAECCLTGALTEVDGPTNFTSAAVPNITLSEDHSITLRYKLKVDANATPGQEIYLKVYDQNGNELEGGYTPALGAKLTVKDYANGGGF